MIRRIEDVPANMVAFRSSGEVTADDFIPVREAVARLVEQTGTLNYMLVLDNSPADFTIGAWLQDALLGLKHLTRWNRAAIVSDSETVRKFTDVFSKLMPGEFRGFEKEEYAEAVTWTSGG